MTTVAELKTIRKLSNTKISGALWLSPEGAKEVARLMREHGMSEDQAILQTTMVDSGFDKAFPDFLPDRACTDDEILAIADRVLPSYADLRIYRWYEDDEAIDYISYLSVAIPLAPHEIRWSTERSAKMVVVLAEPKHDD